MNDEYVMNWVEVVMATSRYSLGIHLGRLKKTTKDFCQDGQHSS
jgi:hypothetical protein